MNNRKWILNRLKQMSIEEIVHRTIQFIGIWFERRRIDSPGALASPAPNETDSPIWMASPQLANQQHYTSAANEILGGILAVFTCNADADDIALDPNKDCKTGVRAPLTFGKTLDYRNEALVGDIKYLWEPNRHLHLVTLAQAYSLTRRELYLKALRVHITSWIDKCPYKLGPNWSSSLENAIRLINWSIVWQLVGANASKLFSGKQGQVFKEKWLSSIYQHMAFVSGHLARYSSANNHLIGEVAGLFIACNTWPYWRKETHRWREAAYKILIEEADKQVHPDGVTKEQAISYQQFVLDFFILSLLSGKSAGRGFPEKYMRQIEKMLEFVASVMDVGGNIPMIGDADDGYVVRLSQDPEFCPYKSLLASGAVLFQRTDFLQVAGGLDDKTRWLFGGAPVQSVQERPMRRFEDKTSFPAGGYYILGCDLGTPEEIRCLIDCGPLGYLAIAAHGHADALALYLSMGGREFLIDPGTYCYHTRRKWREYFRGTSGHNTVRIDRSNQSVSGGNFMWLEKAGAKAVKFETTQGVDAFEGRHDGYRRLDDPVIHTRNVKLMKKEKTILVTDTIQCRQRHYVERFWHFHEDCRVEIQEKSMRVENKGAAIVLSPREDTQMKLFQENDELPLGWVSRRYDQKVPSHTAVFSNAVSGTTTLQTVINLKSDRCTNEN